MATTRRRWERLRNRPQDTDDFDDDDDDVAIEDGERKSDVDENEIATDGPRERTRCRHRSRREERRKGRREEEGDKEEESDKKAAAADKKGDKKTAARKQPTTRKTRGKKKEEEEKEEKAQPEEITMETRDAKDEGTRATSTTTTTTTISDIQEQEEQEKIQEEIDNEDPMQILKLAVATWQKRGWTRPMLFSRRFLCACLNGRKRRPWRLIRRRWRAGVGADDGEESEGDSGGDV